MKRIIFGMAALAAIFVLSATAALAHDHDDNKKVVVCKYVGTPGVDERLQTGNNPIVVSVNALKGFTGSFPYEFADAQGKSIAIRYAENAHDGDISECPAPQGPPETTVVTPVPPTVSPATCDDPEQVIVDFPGGNSDQPEGVDVTVEGELTGPGTVTVTFSTEEGFTFPEGTQTVYTFELSGTLTGSKCDSTPPPDDIPPGHKPDKSKLPKSPDLQQFIEDTNNGADSGGG